jgi:hypothetical protein
MGTPRERDSAQPLAEELAFYESQKAELLMAHQGRFVLIRGAELVGVYDQRTEAYAEGLKRFGNTAFLIKQVLPEDPIDTIPALHFGLIRAHS